MKTKNAMQLKARISNRAREAGIPVQLMMQHYLLERLLERLSRSPWRERVVVKGSEVSPVCLAWPGLIVEYDACIVGDTREFRTAVPNA